MFISHEGKTPIKAKQTFIANGSIIIGDVSIGENSSIWFNAVIRGDENYIRIGKNTNIQDLSCVHVWHIEKDAKGCVIDPGHPCLIGDDVTIGHSCIIHACTIKDRCLIGMGAVIMDGAIIGEDSIVGANSMVTKNKSFPPRSLILGSPAKFVRELSEEEIKSIKASANHYSKLKDKYL